MKRIKVLLDFIELSVAEKIVFFRNVLAKLKAGASIFTNPDESLETAGAAVDTLEANSIAAAGGGRARGFDRVGGAGHAREPAALLRYRIRKFVTRAPRSLPDREHHREQE